MLNSKYPLRLFSPIDVGAVFLYTGGAIVICFFAIVYTQSHNNIVLTSDFEYYERLGGIAQRFYFTKLFILGPVVEEVLFRGFFYRIPRKLYGTFVGGVVSTVLFAAIHGFPVYIIFLSVVFIWSYEKSGSIWSSILAHVAHNVIGYNWYFMD